MRPRAAFSSPRSQFFTIRTHPKPVNNLFIFSKLSNEKKKLTENKTHPSVTVTEARDREIRIALRTNQIVRFVTVSAWKKYYLGIFLWPLNAMLKEYPMTGVYNDPVLPTILEGRAIKLQPYRIPQEAGFQS